MQDTQAFVTLYKAQYPRVLAYARRRLPGLAEAEDCAAEVFRIAWEQDRTPDVGWLFVTARNLTYAAHRAEGHRRDLASRFAFTPEADADPDLGVLEALDRLTEPERELLMAYYWDDLSGAQCARVLGCSVGAVWVRLHRARQALKEVLLTDSGRTAPAVRPNLVRQGETP